VRDERGCLAARLLDERQDMLDARDVLLLAT